MGLPYNLGDRQMMVKMGSIFRRVEFEIMMEHTLHTVGNSIGIWETLYGTYDRGHGHTEKH